MAEHVEARPRAARAGSEQGGREDARSPRGYGETAPHGYAACPFHGELCSPPYRTADPLERCPMCHASWAVILRSGFHSPCEGGRAWPHDVRRARIAEAGRLRGAACVALRRDSGTNTSAVGGGAT